MKGKFKMVCRTLDLRIGETSNVKCETIEALDSNGNCSKQTEGNNKMKDQFGAVAFNLRTVLRRVEDLRQEVEREVNKNIKENIYEVRVSVNNLVGVLKIADDNLRELEELIKAVKVKRETEEGDTSTSSV